jgi:hypothetical protein
MSQLKKINNKVLIFSFIAVFTLPVILAKFALEYDWFNQAATNSGELLNPALDMSSLSDQAHPPKWKFLYILPTQCDVNCTNALYSLTQVWSALGKEQGRAESVVIVLPDSDMMALNTLAENVHLRVIKTDQQLVNQVFKDVKTNGIFIADTLNNIILRYPTQSDPQQAVLHSRDILSDMRKVLKLSRIG